MKKGGGGKDHGPREDTAPREHRESSSSPLSAAAWGLAVFAGTRGAAALLSSASMAAVVAQAVIAEWGLARIGVSWTAPDAHAPSVAQIARRALAGVGVGLAVAALVLGVAAATRGAIVTKGDAPLSLLAIGAMSSGFAAMRDELLLRGLGLRVLAGVRVHPPKLAACAALAAAASLSEPGATAQSVAVAALLAVVLSALWLRDRGAWLAWGANAALTFAVGPLARGGLLDARVARDAWGGGDSGLLGSGSALVVIAPLAIGALAWAARTSRDARGGRGARSEHE